MTRLQPLALALVTATLAFSPAPEGVGYSDTPFLPGGQWRVHDASRPVPAVVTVGATPGAPPSDAIVLFDGKDLSKFEGEKGEAKWKIVGTAMEVNGTGSIHTRDAFGDCQLHVEWAAPPAPEGHSQERGNSGIFLMGRYEVQVLDSFDNPTYADGQAGALYGQFPPLVNACRKPGEWQTYDIVFRAPRFENGALVKPGRVTLFHNGVLVQDAQELLGATRHREVATYEAHDAALPLELQDHGNPVRYRNIWIRKL